MRWRHWLASLAVASLGMGAHARAEADLTVCLQRNDPPLSANRDGQASGFDLALSDTIAHRLGRTLHVQWFVSRDDPDSNLVKDTQALLSDGRCQLMAEYPLTDDTLRPLDTAAVKVPPFEGAKPDDRTRWVKTAALLTTRPYRMDAMAVMLPWIDAGRTIRNLGDLAGKRIGVQIATMADAVAMQYAGGRLDDQVMHFPDGRALFDALQDHRIDAAFADLRAFDAWRLRHGTEGVMLSGYRHSVRFNMGFAGLLSEKALVEQVDAVLADLQAHDLIAPLASEAGLTFMAPEPPDIRPDVGLVALNGD